MAQGVKHSEIDGLTWLRKNIYKCSDWGRALCALHDAGARDTHFVEGRCLMLCVTVGSNEVFVEISSQNGVFCDKSPGGKT